MVRSVLLVMYMDGCPFCPPAIEAASKVTGADVININSSHPIVKDLGVSSFPTIWLSLPNSLYDFGSRERSPDSLEQFILDKASNILN